MSTGDDGSSFKINVINLTEREVMEKNYFPSMVKEKTVEKTIIMGFSLNVTEIQ